MTDPLGLIPGSQDALPIRSGARGASPATGGASFKDALMKQLDQVNRLQHDAEVAVEDLATGETDMDQVMIAKQKADIAFQMLLEVRNQMMDAYAEIKQIRV